jgi:ABC-type transport system involved in multi-copper enzyme maturation permease subunit
MSENITIARRMIGAEFLKLRKKRGLMAWALTLSAGSVTLFFAWKAIHHASNPGMSPPAGGINGYAHGLEVVGIFIGPLAAALIGAEAGAGDAATGVFRDLVVTGRSRLALFAARIPGALMLCLPVIAAGYALVVAGTFLFAGGTPTPSTAMVLNGLGWALLVDGAVCVVAVGLASLTTSRPATITALVGFELVASPLLLSDSTLGSAREVLLDGSVLHLAPTLSDGAPVVPESLFVALLVIGVWLATATCLGAWRTKRMDA